MTPVINPIIPGIPWEQEFLCDPLLTPAGTELRVILRPRGQPRAVGISKSLTHPEPGRHVMTILPGDTANLKAPTELVGDFVLYEANIPERALFRGMFPVEKVGM